MRIFIITMDDPLQTNKMMRQVISARREEIVGLAVSKGGRLKPSKGQSKAIYMVSILLIMGLPAFIKNSLITIDFKIRGYLSNKTFIKNPSILQFAKDQGIPAYMISSPNQKDFLKVVRSLQPDVIINQSQSILKTKLLTIPSIGTINRHNALLPKNRGRLTPFWVLYNREQETGVSIHFVEKSIDSGPIIVQKKFKVSSKENFNSLVKKNYEIAGSAMLEALKKLEQSRTDFLPNEDNKATYNRTPKLKEAILYRWRRLMSTQALW